VVPCTVFVLNGIVDFFLCRNKPHSVVIRVGERKEYRDVLLLVCSIVRVANTSTLVTNVLTKTKYGRSRGTGFILTNFITNVHSINNLPPDNPEINS